MEHFITRIQQRQHHGIRVFELKIPLRSNFQHCVASLCWYCTNLNLYQCNNATGRYGITNTSIRMRSNRVPRLKPANQFGDVGTATQLGTRTGSLQRSILINNTILHHSLLLLLNFFQSTYLHFQCRLDVVYLLIEFN